MSSENALRKLLNAEVSVKKETPVKITKKTPGRPKVPKEKQARNFTLCLAPQYLDFLDKMTVKDAKVSGRGRKIRFIIERFIEHEKRSLHHVKVLKQSLKNMQKVLETFGPMVKKNEKLNLSPKEKTRITEAVDQVHAMMNLLAYTPKALHKILPPEERALISFSMDWKNNQRGVVL